jgi:hypothetical protein
MVIAERYNHWGYSRNRIAVPRVATALGLFHQEKGRFSDSIEATYFLFLL